MKIYIVWGHIRKRREEEKGKDELRREEKRSSENGDQIKGEEGHKVQLI